MHVTRSMHTNRNQNHTGTCWDHSANDGGDPGGGQLGGHTTNGDDGGTAGGSTGDGGPTGGHAEKNDAIDIRRHMAVFDSSLIDH